MFRGSLVVFLFVGVDGWFVKFVHMFGNQVVNHNFRAFLTHDTFSLVSEEQLYNIVEFFARERWLFYEYLLKWVFLFLRSVHEKAKF